jgi:hypothetical protein
VRCAGAAGEADGASPKPRHAGHISCSRGLEASRACSSTSRAVLHSVAQHLVAQRGAATACARRTVECGPIRKFVSEMVLPSSLGRPFSHFCGGNDGNADARRAGQARAVVLLHLPIYPAAYPVPHDLLYATSTVFACQPRAALQICAPDVIFLRLNASSYWLFRLTDRAVRVSLP